MKGTKLWIALVAVLVLVLGQVAAVQAAPLQQATTTDVTINSITETTDSGGATVYEVNVTYPGGYSTTLTLSQADAVSLGLVLFDGTTYTINTAVIGTTIPLDSALVGQDPCALPDGASQPVGEALTGFFCGSQGVSYDMIMGWQGSGYGFGVIAQALFMAQALQGADPTLVAAILSAKQSKDYSTLMTEFSMPDNVKNWGQLRKWVLSEEVKSLTNLGAVMSGRATPLVAPVTTTTTSTSTDTTTQPGHGKGKGNGHHGGGNGKNGPGD